jgi:hypothetical protein
MTTARVPRPRPEAYTAPVSPLLPGAPGRLETAVALLYLPVGVFAVFGGAISFLVLTAVGIDVMGGAGWWEPAPFVMWFGGTLGFSWGVGRLERWLRRVIRG